MSEFIAYHWIL